METNPREQVLQKVYAAFNSRNVDGVLAHMHPDVDWPNGMEGGRVHGHNGVREYWTRQWKSLSPNVQPIAFASDELGRTVVEVRQIVHDIQGTLLVDQMVKHAYVIEGGLIRKMEIQNPGGGGQ
jgi:SnoaL-like domain